MISVEQALAILQENMPRPQVAKLNLSKALGCWLAEDILAPEPSPRYTNSAMDGFAVRYLDCQEATADSGIPLSVVGESQAGIPFTGKVTSGQAVRISTGAMLPDGADTIVRVEDTREEGDQVHILKVKALGQDVRREGEEFARGDLLFRQGTRLGARQLALLAAVGREQVAAYLPPTASLLITGTELAAHDSAEIAPHQIRDSNSVMLASAVSESGARLLANRHVEDSLEETVAAIRETMQSGAGIILCSGGVSVGNHDHVKAAALECGFTELFWRIKQKPGKPLFAAKKGEVLLFGLPGNPVSAFMCFTNYVRPLIAALLGAPRGRRTLTGISPEKLANYGKRTLFVRVSVEDKPNAMAVIRQVPQQGSHMLSSIVNADGYIVLEPGQVAEPGSLMEVVLFT